MTDKMSFEGARLDAGKILRGMDTAPIIEPWERLNALTVALALEIVGSDFPNQTLIEVRKLLDCSYTIARLGREMEDAQASSRTVR